MALQHRNLLLNSFLILLDLGKFGSGWSSRGIKVSQGGRRKMGVGRGDSSDQVERQRQRSTKAWTNYLLKVLCQSGPSATPATCQGPGFGVTLKGDLRGPLKFLQRKLPGLLCLIWYPLPSPPLSINPASNGSARLLEQQWARRVESSEPGSWRVSHRSWRNPFLAGQEAHFRGQGGHGESKGNN